MPDLDQQLSDLARPLADRAGVDLVAVEVKGEGSRRRVRVIVDRKGGVDLATCQRISRELGKALDEIDPLAQRYTLEVTSPGTDRPLADQRAFDRVEGRRVKAILRVDEDRTREVRGTVATAGDSAVVLTTDDGDVEVAYDEIIKATQELPW